MDSTEEKESPDKNIGTPCEFHVVGVGASAGGLEAIEQLFEFMPDDTGAAFVVVQHLSPDFKSHMEELLARKTSMKIMRVTDRLPVEPNTIYLIPPNTEMAIANGQLLLTERDRSETLNLPIDAFFRSLSNDCGKMSIGIVLSGTGSDGSRGIVNINEAGGLVLCQDEDSAKFDGMPLSAQETDSVHLVLEPAQMASAIATYIDQSLSPENLREQEIGTVDEKGLELIFKLLRREHKIDFSLYKPTTVRRRVDRRISLGNFPSVEHYASVLQEDAEELNLLYKDLLIGVTQFFRDRQAFEFLRKETIQKIIEKKSESEQSIRVWIAGCATGEEAYSIAISFYEAFRELDQQPNIKIFATDVHRKSLHFASVGIYPDESCAKLAPERLAKYFVKRPNGYEVIAEIRKLIVFAPHDVVNDAPFTRMDLVTCRNLLIYLQPIVQKKVISLFHFALRTGAFLFLGPSETPGDLGDEFEPENKKWRIYRKRRDIRLTNNIKLPLGGTAMVRPYSQSRRNDRPTPEAQMLATYDLLLDRCMSPSFLVDEGGDLVHSFGGAERFLQMRGGRVSTNIMQIIHEDLKTSVSGGLQHVSKEGKAIRYTGITVKTSAGLEQIRLKIDPILDPRTKIGHTLITIEPIELPSEGNKRQLDEDVNVSDLARNHIASLENELRYAKENLQATVEELETSNEELQATNEELVASNEEMQSTNEELQSVNEELYTVNHEYQRKIAELTELTDDMNNLFELTEVGVVFLDRELRVRRFTPRIADTFSLMPQDIGRPIANFAHNIKDEAVFDNLEIVLNQEVKVDREVKDQRGNHWLMRIMPYRAKLRVEGVILTLIDINSVKASDAKLNEYKNIIESTVEAVVGTDVNGMITSWNPGAANFYGYSQEEAIGRPIYILSPDSEINDSKSLIGKVLQGTAVRQHRTERITKQGAIKNIMLTVSPVLSVDGEVVGTSSISHDYTDRKQAEDQQEKLAAVVRQTSDFVGTFDADGKTIVINPAGRRMLGLTSDDEVKGKSISNWHAKKVLRVIQDEAIPHALQHGVWRGRTDILNRDGEMVPLSSVIIAHKNDRDELEYISENGRDISQELALEKELRKRETFLRKTLDGLGAFAWVLRPDGTLIEANQPALFAADLKPNDVLGKPFTEAYWWSYSSSVQDRLHQAIRTAANGDPVRYDVDMRLAEEQFATIDFQLTPLRNEKGSITHLIPSGTDITDRVKFESRSHLFRLAFESSLTAMVITDPRQVDNPIVYANPGFEKLTGYTAEEVIGRNCRFLQGLETDAPTVKKLRKAIRNGDSCQVKLLNYRKNRKSFWNELVITPVRSEAGELTHFIGIQFDMTEHQRAENKLSRARDVAEAANEAKSAFVANMSHEIRTPLTTVVGMTEMLLDQEVDKEKHDTLQLIRQSGKHLITLVNDVLDMSKIEAGKLEADMVEASPMQIIEDVADSMRYRSGEKGLKFSLDYHGLIPERIVTDPVRLRQVLFNLTGNAIKFTEKGMVSLHCKVINQDAKPMLEIKVKDTGVGFKKSEIQILFERFTQVDDSPTRRQGGTGLGLFISRRLVELMGGTLTAESRPNRGSCFIVQIPTGELSSQVMIDPSSRTSARHGELAGFGPSDLRIDGNVLVVEDTRGIQRLLQRMLENAGARVEIASDGREALEKFLNDGSCPYDLVLLDMHMPRLSGYETVAEIRKLGIEIPIIALTASAMLGDREKCLAAGCDDYLTKPIDRRKLLEKVMLLMQ